MKTVLVVEDHLTISEVISVVMQRRGFKVVECPNGFDAISQIQAVPLDALITDLVLDTIPGVEIIRAFRKKNPTGLIVAVSGKGRVFLEEARANGADVTIEKPFSIDEIVEALDNL